MHIWFPFECPLICKCLFVSLSSWILRRRPLPLSIVVLFCRVLVFFVKCAVYK